MFSEFSEYRDDLSAAEERLASLDAAQRKRNRTGHKALEAPRRRLTSKRDGTGMVALYLGAFLTIYALKFEVRAPGMAGTVSLIAFSIGVSVAALSGGWFLWRRLCRRERYAQIAADLREVEMETEKAKLALESAPTTLAETLSRIAAHEAQRTLSSEGRLQTGYGRML